jgi:hypothetical protein
MHRHLLTGSAIHLPPRKKLFAQASQDEDAGGEAVDMQ